MAIFLTYHGLTGLEKCHFFRLFELLVFIYSLERLFFVLEYRERHFPAPILPKRKSLEKWPFLDQMGKKCKMKK